MPPPRPTFVNPLTGDDPTHPFRQAMQSYLAFSEQADIKQDNDERKLESKILSGELDPPDGRISREARLQREARVAKWASFSPDDKKVVKGFVAKGLDKILGKP
jgi:hypothetical protein